ncbi:TetR family transcriptional regulator C-terminal domain-containing protein [uncultured Amphritea sp.]|mgnify:FL=1|uniref:TetR family transcriptional regulator C-terminal domain-containing protein n=1 Tax=uncultured Amphritea sp. TaxID=981605 RepID=UPI0026366748|nr:TetR family transcriptional regulator C-terminal domain-containing protein [uncultured Amphritea sp.]
MPNSSEEVVIDKPRRRSRIREGHENKILSVAEHLFSQNGFNGTALETIAEKAGMSKQNLIYYFSSKEVLYQQVLKNILDMWVEKMALLDQLGENPKQMLRNYIRGKVELSRSNPNASKVFAIEIINGAPYLKEYLKSHLTPALDADVKLVKEWIADGIMDDVDPYHLFFMIWSSTQTYADFSSQISISLGKEKLQDDDFDNATEFLTHLVIKGLGMK